MYEHDNIFLLWSKSTIINSQPHTHFLKENLDEEKYQL